MVFNSLEFGVFFFATYLLYLLLPHRGQNRMLLAASYVFYGMWDWRFLSLIFASTVLDYYCGIKVRESRGLPKGRWFLGLSVAGNLGILGFFKYFDFFSANLNNLLLPFGLSLSPLFAEIILPVGISFYTFQTMSYSIDIYRGELEPTRRFWDFALFVAFFPQLVAGPIERAKRLLPQIIGRRQITLEKVTEGCYLLLWGYFLKVFVADNLAVIADPVFAAEASYSGPGVLLGIYAFAFQIFCDFAGYSSIARGLAKWMGIDLMVNFRLPYFTKNPSEFWQHWHISLSSWLRDYLYIPLGGNRGGRWMTLRNLMLTMLLGGLWHGAAWTFIVWGAYHGILLIGHRLMMPLLSRIRFEPGSLGSGAWTFFQIVFFFHVICLGWLFFRANSLGQAGTMMGALLFDFQISDLSFWLKSYVKAFLLILPLFVIQLFQYLKKDLEVVYRMPWVIQGVALFALLSLTVIFGAEGGREFIYFQF